MPVVAMELDKDNEAVQPGDKALPDKAAQQREYDQRHNKEEEAKKLLKFQQTQKFYSNIFPATDLYKWLSYGDDEYFSRREFSFTIPIEKQEVYTRFRSFENGSQLCNKFKQALIKMDIGGVYNVAPKTKKEAPLFIAMEKEICFDIDASDYDAVRQCCKDKKICSLCWRLMATAVKVLNFVLRECFGFRHLLFVFSGGRGIHCWVCDRDARNLADDERSAVAEFLNVISGGDGRKLNIEKQLRAGRLHPTLKTVYENIVHPGFKSFCLDDDADQNSIHNPAFQGVLLEALMDYAPSDAKNDVRSLMEDRRKSGEEKWKAIGAKLTAVLNKQRGSNQNKQEGEKILKLVEFAFMWPKLDINVSKMRNHLLKSPFVIHPSSGNICVPFDPTRVSEFNPATCPKVADVVQAWKNDCKNDQVLEKYQPYLDPHGAFASFMAGMTANQPAKAES